MPGAGEWWEKTETAAEMSIGSNALTNFSAISIKEEKGYTVKTINSASWHIP